MTGEQALEFYKEMQEYFGDRLPNFEYYPRQFAYYVKLFKYYKASSNESE